MEEKIEVVLNKLNNDSIKLLVTRVIDRNYSAFITSPASCGNHHSYNGGLLDHSYSTAMLADSICSHFTNQGRDLKKDVVIAGAFLHDIGKVFCYNKIDGQKEPYESTWISRHFHHIPVGFHIVTSVAESLNLKEEDYYDILHIILSHHGRLEYHSPVVPKTPEAFIVHKSDYLDAYIDASPEMRGIYNK